jgi:hypothetical protein
MLIVPEVLSGLGVESENAATTVNGDHGSGDERRLV